MSEELVSWLLEQIADQEERVRADCGPDVVWSDSTPSVLTPTTHRASRVLAECAAKRAIIVEHRDASIPDEDGFGVDPDETGWHGDHSRPDDGRACRRCGVPEEYGVAYPCRTLRILGQLHADRPGYQESWRP